MTDSPIAPMPVLPIFFKLADRSVLIAGDGSNGMAWKAALLHAAGGRIRLVTPTPTPDLVETASVQQRVDLEKRIWNEDDLNDVAIAVGDFADSGAARKFASTCRARKIPVNVIDRPSLCDFQFGALVNRAPLMIAVSTDGASPILAQTVRKKIEAIMPRALSGWTRRAAELRQTLVRRLPAMRDRRSFWTRFADAAFTRKADDIDSIVEALIGNTPAQATTGQVSLVGAGPGDSELLTLRAVGVLQAADVILHDDLIGGQVLDLARREARRIAVGKRGGVRRSCKQEDINAQMLRLAREGKHIVRLKSGDPGIFGRAGEEIAMLRAAGVPVEIVPGVTAATATAARLTTSLTHRDGAPGVKFITAHSRHGRLPDLDWRAAADPKTTLMIYMGAGTAQQTARTLIAHGLAEQTPVVIATAVSQPEERFEHTTLGDLTTARIDRTYPVLICVGRVFAATA